MGLSEPLGGFAAVLAAGEMAGGMSANVIETTVRTAAGLSGGNGRWRV